MKKVFLDTNILMDFVENREKREYAETIIELGKTGVIQLFASYLSFANMGYILRKRQQEERYRPKNSCCRLNIKKITTNHGNRQKSVLLMRNRYIFSTFILGSAYGLKIIRKLNKKIIQNLHPCIITVPY